MTAARSSTGTRARNDRLLDDLEADTIAAARAALGKSESVGQRRMLALHGGSRDELEIHPNLWAVEHFALSGYPHLEEAYWLEEGVIPELAARGLLERAAGGGGSPILVASGR